MMRRPYYVVVRLDLLKENIFTIRDAISLRGAELYEWLGDPDWKAVPAGSTIEVAFAWGYLQSAADAADMTLLQLADEVLYQTERKPT